ncbi:MAG: hypothetical protein AAF480_12785 [Actinomycetota bacterium]
MPDEQLPVPVFIPIDAGRTIDEAGVELPTVVIDAADSPQVADLARVHATEGVGDIRTDAIRVDDLVLVGVRMTVPVRAAFAIALDALAHRPLLDDVVAAGALVIAHTDPQASERPPWLAVDIDGPALAARIELT